MAESIDKVASAAMTAFYGGLRPAGGQYRLEHFIWLCGAADSKLKQDEYEKNLAYARQMRWVNIPIFMSADNYTTVTVEVKDNKAVLPSTIMSFPGDNSLLGVDSVKPEKQCKPFIRLNPEQDWQVCDIKDVVFWKPVFTQSENKKLTSSIEFINLDRVCKVDKIIVRYISQLNADSIVQESRKWAILNMVTIFVKSAKEGMVVDMSNDGNVNSTIATEVNKYLAKASQGR